MQVVLDANVIVSGIICTKGAPAQVLASWQGERFDLVTSADILAELERVLHYPKLRERYRLPDEEIGPFLRLLRRHTVHIEGEARLSIDPTDNRHLECAVAGKAQYIVSGDRHLLELKEYRGIQILTPREFLVALEI
jgi:putative PIN family toxin of toxin-antitoxin system